MCVELFRYFFHCFVDNRHLHRHTPSYPTRRSTDLMRPTGIGRSRCRREPAGTGCESTDHIGSPRHLAATPRPRVPQQESVAVLAFLRVHLPARSEEHTSELQSLMRISYAVFCLTQTKHTHTVDTLKKAILEH